MDISQQGVPALPGSAKPFVGRDRELDRLRQRLNWSDRRRGHIVQVTGDPGIGKTRLLGEFATLARAAGLPVLWGQATEFERDVPFGAFIDALDDHVSDLPPGRLADLGAEHLTLLRAAGPLRLGSAGGDADLMDLERFRLHRAMRALLEVLAEPDGLVLVLDDVHWADGGSGELLDHLLRHPARARLLLAVAYRPRQVCASLANALARAHVQGTSEVVALGPLSLLDVETLLGPGIQGARRRELYQVSGGNPLYLEALIKDGMREPAGASGTPGNDEKACAHGGAAAVQAALSAELAALSPVELRVAGATAVAGDTADSALVAAIAECDAPVALAALDRLAERDLLRPGAVPGTWCYRHPVLRSVVYEAAGAGWRLAAHARAAIALQARGASATARAHHVERSASPGDQQALDVLLEAASTAMNTAPATAAHWLQVALRLLPEAESTLAMRLGLLGMRAKTLGVTGRLAESRDVLHEVLALLPGQPPELRAEVVGFCALMDRLLGRHAEAQALLLRELDGLAASDAAATAMVKLELAAGRLTRGDFTADRDWAQEATVIARRLGDRSLLAAALAVCVLNDCSDASISDRSFSLLDEAAELVDSLPDSDLARHLTAASHIGWAELFLERIEDALRHLDRGLRLARATGQNHMLTYLLLSYGSACGVSGRLREAGDTFDDAVEAAALAGSDELRVMALGQRCWITLWQGDVTEAQRMGEEAVARAGGLNDWFSAVAHGMLAQVRFYANDPAGCVELLLRGGGGPQLPRLDPVYRVGWLELLVEASAVHDPEQAATWADQAEALAATMDLPRRRGYGHLARAWASRSGDPATAATQALAAAASFDQAGDSVDAGRAYLLAATALEASGRVDEARRELARAQALFDACGAGLFQARALREQRRLNARAPRQSHRSGQLNGLTRRETQIAELVKEGMTNRQIAQQLYLSPRTVEVHLSRILAKLDVTTRSAVAPAMTRAKAQNPSLR